MELDVMVVYKMIDKDSFLMKHVDLPTLVKKIVDDKLDVDDVHKFLDIEAEKSINNLVELIDFFMDTKHIKFPTIAENLSSLNWKTVTFKYRDYAMGLLKLHLQHETMELIEKMTEYVGSMKSKVNLNIH